MKYDVIIVGGGAAGSVLAGRLSEDPNRSVLVLEAGKDYPDFDLIPDEVKFGHTRYAESPESGHNWALRGMATEEQGEIHVAQGKVIGGGSSINGQAMQRGMPEDYDDWAELGNDQWSYSNVLPFFRRMENDLDIQDDFHGTEGPMPVRRRQSSPTPAIQRAFLDACVQEGHSAVEDTNGANAAGVGVSPTNNLGGVRVSTAIAYLSQVRHRLNLTVRGEVHVRKVLFDGSRAVGVEAESGGEVFTVEAEKVVLSSGALRSPQLLMLSGIGPKDHLAEFGIPVINDLPGVGQSLFNHLSVHINYKVKDGVDLPVDLDAPHYRLIFTAPDSEMANDLVLSTVNVVDERERAGWGRANQVPHRGRSGRPCGPAILHSGCAPGVGLRASVVGRSQRSAEFQLPVPAASRRPATGEGGHPVRGQVAGVGGLPRTWSITASLPRTRYWRTTSPSTCTCARRGGRRGTCRAHAEWGRTPTR